MRTLIVTLTDNAVAQAALRLLHASAKFESRSLAELPSEPARELPLYDTVVFVDTDPRIKEGHMETLPGQITHPSRAANIVAQARECFQFSGKAFLCRIPASRRKSVSRREAFAYKIAAAIEVLMRRARAEEAPAVPGALAGA